VAEIDVDTPVSSSELSKLSSNALENTCVSTLARVVMSRNNQTRASSGSPSNMAPWGFAFAGQDHEAYSWPRDSVKELSSHALELIRSPSLFQMRYAAYAVDTFGIALATYEFLCANDADAEHRAWKLLDAHQTIEIW
jgi:hypothetical protein